MPLGDGVSTLTYQLVSMCCSVLEPYEPSTDLTLRWNRVGCYLFLSAFAASKVIHPTQVEECRLYWNGFDSCICYCVAFAN